MFEVDVNNRDQETISITASSDAPLPKISILTLEGKEASTVRIGDRLTFRIEIPDNTPYGIFARSCIAMAKDARSTFEIIDEHGCPVDHTIFPNFTPMNNGNALESNYEAFRFTESYGVIFQCNVNKGASLDFSVPRRDLRETLFLARDSHSAATRTLLTQFSCESACGRPGESRSKVERVNEPRWTRTPPPTIEFVFPRSRSRSHPGRAKSDLVRSARTGRFRTGRRHVVHTHTHTKASADHSQQNSIDKAACLRAPPSHRRQQVAADFPAVGPAASRSRARDMTRLGWAGLSPKRLHFPAAAKIRKRTAATTTRVSASVSDCWLASGNCPPAARRFANLARRHGPQVRRPICSARRRGAAQIQSYRAAGRGLFLFVVVVVVSSKPAALGLARGVAPRNDEWKNNWPPPPPLLSRSFAESACGARRLPATGLPPGSALREIESLSQSQLEISHNEIGMPPPPAGRANSAQHSG
ncbi:Zona pellucida-like domain containing 3 [Olea europaea subsp. europaea]|uniref:Zona pellucida-like domain containing 3 n=1 Tax=Olea europaea subsp. europaea TaxID=158383 RepID=A0A8S0TKK7_OLEEU|nr:Zona pellucida-like domain containing 3 [Olea europaea subsp. europaea]